jgi:shikimate 5-dehydrogenase
MRARASSTGVKSETTTVEFGLDGSTYEIDLSPPEAAVLRDSLAAWQFRGNRTTVPHLTEALKILRVGPRARGR